MAVPLAQHRHWSTNAGASETGGNTFKFILDQPTLSGNCLVFCLNYAYSAGRTIAITDDKSNSWPAATVVLNNSGLSETTAIYVLPGCIAGTQAIQVVFDTAILGVQGQIGEFYNIAASPGAGSTSNNASTAPTITAGSFTPTNNDGTGGNLIYHFSACTNGDGNWSATLGPTSNPTAVAAMSSWQLESTDYALGIFAQTIVQTTHAAINPTVTVTQTNADPYNSVAVALKIDATQGTQPTGMYILHHAVVRSWAAADTSPQNFGFPCAGNLIVGMLDVVASGSAWSATSSTPSNSWTKVTATGSAPTSVPQCWYAGNATPAHTMTLSLTWVGGSANPLWHFYDIVQAATSPYDTEIDGLSSSAAGPRTITNSPAITPSTANGLVLACCVAGTGPETTGSTTGGTYDNLSYTGETDSSYANNGDAWQHVGSAPASAISINWHLVSGTTQDVAFLAVAFKLGAVGGSNLNVLIGEPLSGSSVLR